MADNTKESTRLIAKLPTRLIVNTDTGAADLYVDEGVFGRTLVATGSATGNNWSVNDEFVKKYNNRNGTNLTQSQLQQTFAKDYQKDLNKDRAAIVNKYSPYDTKKYLQETAKIPGVINPQTGTKTGDTTPTPSTAKTEEKSGDNTNPYNPEEFGKALGTDDRTRNDFNQLGPLVYPNDLGQTKQDIIQFDMLQYKPKKFASGQGKFGFIRDDKNRTSIGTVVLPIPSGISDTTGVTWGEDRLNAAEAELAKIALGTITEGGGGLAKSINDTIKTVTANTGALQTAAAAAFAESAVGVRGLLTRTTGAVINPNLELLFNSPTLRPFNFRFKMSARNKDEAKTIINIIRFFRQGMAPQRTPSNIFLKSPHIFKITYKNRSQGGEHKYIGKIKECALQNFTVDYTPEGQYATFYDGMLISYEISMQFTELEPIFNEDNDKNYGEIGY